jgi:hypothetical protein
VKMAAQSLSAVTHCSASAQGGLGLPVVAVLHGATRLLAQTPSAPIAGTPSRYRALFNVQRHAPRTRRSVPHRAGSQRADRRH